MRRAVHLLRAVLLALALPAAASASDPVCTEPDTAGVRRCAVGLPVEAASALHQEQAKSQWCWAASVAMLLEHAGVGLSQQEIVRRVFMTELDRGVSAEQLAQLSGAPWDAAVRRDGSSGPVTLQAQVVAGPLGSPEVRRELGAGRPLLLGAAGHAVVLTGLVYEEFTVQGAWRVLAGTVVDPAPGGGVRPLSAAELRPTLLAAVAPALPGGMRR